MSVELLASVQAGVRFPNLVQSVWLEDGQVHCWVARHQLRCGVTIGDGGIDRALMALCRGINKETSRGPRLDRP